MRPLRAYQATACLDVARAQHGRGSRARRDRPGGRSRCSTCTAPPKRETRASKPPPGPTEDELAGIADGHHLGPGLPGRLQEGDQGGVVGHGRLVEHGHVARRQLQGVVLDAVVERGQGAAVDARLPVEGAGGLARRRGAHHHEAGGLEAVPGGGQGRGLARAGHADDQLHSPPGGEHRLHRLALAVGQGTGEPLLGPGHGRLAPPRRDTQAALRRDAWDSTERAMASSRAMVVAVA